MVMDPTLTEILSQLSDTGQSVGIEGLALSYFGPSPYVTEAKVVMWLQKL
jgi:hypothetical protein